MGSRKAHLTHEYKSEVARISAILFQDDPVGINFGENTDEYEPEAAAIVRRIPEANGEEDVARIIREEFLRRFGADTIDPDSSYADLARLIWREPWGHYQKDTLHSGYAFPVSRSLVGEALRAAGARTGRLYFSMPGHASDADPLVLARAYFRGIAHADYHGVEPTRADEGTILWIQAVPKHRLADARHHLDTEGLAHVAEWVAARLRAASAGEALATLEADLYVFARDGGLALSEVHPSQR